MKIKKTILITLAIVFSVLLFDNCKKTCYCRIEDEYFHTGVPPVGISLANEWKNVSESTRKAENCSDLDSYEENISLYYGTRKSVTCKE